VALHEATDTLYRLMFLAPYLPGGMVVAIAVKSATLNYIVFNRLTSFYTEEKRVRCDSSDD
jgi:hypothetical protein